MSIYVLRKCYMYIRTFIYVKDLAISWKQSFCTLAVKNFATGSSEPVRPDLTVEPDMEPNRNRVYQSRILDLGSDENRSGLEPEPDR